MLMGPSFFSGIKRKNACTAEDAEDAKEGHEEDNTRQYITWYRW